MWWLMIMNYVPGDGTKVYHDVFSLDPHHYLQTQMLYVWSIYLR